MRWLVKILGEIKIEEGMTYKYNSPTRKEKTMGLRWALPREK